VLRGVSTVTYKLASRPAAFLNSHQMALFLMFIPDSVLSVIVKVSKTKIREEWKPQLQRCKKKETRARM
jgi:hypothetical protein